MTWKDMECICGLMEDTMKDNTKMIRSADSEYTCGQMEENTKVGGIKASNTV
jgi:hypothetical protein